VSPALRLLEFALLSGFVVALALAALTAALRPVLSRGLQPLAPERRARIAWWLLVGPAVAGLTYTLATLLTGTGAQALPALQASCAAHQGSWWHACLWHPIERVQQPWLWIAVTAVAVGLFSTMSRTVVAVWRGQRQLRALIALSRRARGEGDVVIVDVAKPLALAVGIGRGHVLLSRTLVETLPADQLDAVIAHERAHLRHGDVLRHLLARAASLIHFPATRRHLLDQLRLAAEQRCDGAAAERVGSPLLVAETLLAVERLHRPGSDMQPAVLAVAFANGFLAERIEALLAPGERAAYPLGLCLAALASAFLVLSTGWVHHLTEFLVLLTAG
jgi:Zn-dependent protease with chaperone function